MPDSMIVFLDRFIAQKGKPATLKVLGGLTESQVEPLIAAETVEKNAASKYLITAKGIEFWFKHAAASKSDAEIVSLLKEVESTGKITANKWLTKYATDAGLIAAVARPRNTYALSEQGKSILESWPVKESFFAAQSSFEAFKNSSKQLLHSLSETLGKLRDESSATLDQSKQEIQSKLDHAVHGVTESLQALMGKTLAEQSVNIAKATLEQIVESQQAKLKAVEHELAAAREEFALKLEAERQKLHSQELSILEKLESVEKQFAAASKPVAAQPAAASLFEAAPVAAKDPWQVTKAEYKTLHDKVKTLGLEVIIPELTDQVLGQLPSLSVKEFHALLRSWQVDRRLVLKICNDPYLEPRKNEGIETSEGLLFYVQLHD
jgi:DNA-binding PadR family transcriptional regulator